MKVKKLSAFIDNGLTLYQERHAKPIEKSYQPCSKTLNNKITKNYSREKQLLYLCTNNSIKKGCRRNPWGSYSYADLIEQAINSSENKRMTLSQIYDWISTNIPYFNKRTDSFSSAGWKNSVRHNLSLHSRFKRIPGDNLSRSSHWIVDTSQIFTEPSDHDSMDCNFNMDSKHIFNIQNNNYSLTDEIKGYKRSLVLPINPMKLSNPTSSCRVTMDNDKNLLKQNENIDYFEELKTTDECPTVDDLIKTIYNDSINSKLNYSPLMNDSLKYHSTTINHQYANGYRNTYSIDSSKINRNIDRSSNSLNRSTKKIRNQTL